jgi:hypothetical protein
MHPVGVGDLHDLEAERRLYAFDAPDACHEPEAFEVIERRHDRLLAAHRQMRAQDQSGDVLLWEKAVMTWGDPECCASALPMLRLRCHGWIHSSATSMPDENWGGRSGASTVRVA